MCKLCDQGQLQNHDDESQRWNPRRGFLKASMATGAAAATGLFANAARADDEREPADSGHQGRRILIRGGAVMSMDPKVGNFAQADVLIEGKKIAAVGPSLHAGGATVIDARGRIVMPGFIDTHHHQFETALRSFLADGVLINDGSGSPSANQTYYEYILLKFAPVYRPQDVYINELFGGLSQLDHGVTTVHDISQIHHSPQHSDAAIQALFDTGRRAAFGYFESAGGVAGNQYPTDAPRIKKQWFSSSDQLVHMIMGGEVYLGDPTTDLSWTIGRQLGLQIAAHILSPFGIRPILDKLAAGTGGNGHIGLGPDNLFIHMTGMSDQGWQGVKDAGAQVSLAVPIEMNMRHGMPPILKMQSLGIEPSLSVDVECTLTADFFTQMRSMMNMQRMVVNQMILEQGNFVYPQPVADTGPWNAAVADHARRAALCHDERRQGAATGRQGRLADAGQGGRHHHPRRAGNQRRTAQSRAGRCRVTDGPRQRRDGARRRQGAQVERAAARRRPAAPAPAARSLARLRVQRSRYRARSVQPQLSPRRRAGRARNENPP